MTKGFNDNFLGNDLAISIPGFMADIKDDVLNKNELRDGYIRDYLHYSVVMSKSKKQALYSIANLNQDLIKSVRGRRWFVDPIIGEENQLDNRYYKHNPWDRGHLTRRSAVAWGDSNMARNASNDSCSYANATLQHENFNQDEWRVPEEYVKEFNRAVDGKLNIITGSIFTDNDRFYTPRDSNIIPARIPSGFWKVIYYIDKNKSNEAGSSVLGCESFIAYQDDFSLIDKRKHSSLQINTLQVTISQIEDLTGIMFDKNLYEANPLIYSDISGPEMYAIKTAATSSNVKANWPGHIIHDRLDIQKHGFIRV